jgi:hypothetical protein
MDQTRRFLHRCHGEHIEDQYAVFKDPSVMNKWREELQPEIRETIIEEIRGTDLERFLL